MFFQDKVELRARFRLFIFDLQVYSSSQHYTRHFVNMYISDRITAGEVLKIITGTEYVTFPCHDVFCQKTQSSRMCRSKRSLCHYSFLSCLDYPTSWYGVFLHDNERIADDAKLCQSLEGKGISKQDSLVVHMVHQPLHVSCYHGYNHSYCRYNHSYHGYNHSYRGNNHSYHGYNHSYHGYSASVIRW